MPGADYSELSHYFHRSNRIESCRSFFFFNVSLQSPRSHPTLQSDEIQFIYVDIHRWERREPLKQKHATATDMESQSSSITIVSF